MAKRMTAFLLALLLSASLASCSADGDDQVIALDDAYPADIFRIYDKSDVTKFQTEGGGDAVSYFIEAKSSHNVGRIAEFYDILLQNADISNRSLAQDAYELEGSFYGYDFRIGAIPADGDKKYRTVLTIALDEAGGSADSGQSAEGTQSSDGGQRPDGAEPIAFLPNILVNGMPYDMEPVPVWFRGQLWLPGLQLFELLDFHSVDYDSWIGYLIHSVGEPTITCYFGEGDSSYGTDSNRFTTDLPPIRYDGEIYLSREMISNVFGDILECGEQGTIANLCIEGLYLDNAQQGNGNVYQKLALKDVYELGDTRLSTMVSGCYNAPAQDWLGWIDEQRAEGFTEIRFSVNHTDNASPDYAQTDYLSVERDFPDEYKQVFEYAHEKGMTVRYVLGFWDYQYRAGGGEFSYDRMGTQGEIDRYIDYVKMTVTELRGLVDRYELWNEPDANYGVHQMIQPKDYINMAVQAIPAIKAIDPDTEVIMLSSCGFLTDEDMRYTLKILNSDATALADGISLHTVNMDAMPQNRSDYYYNYENMMNELRDTAKANGFDGVIIADELNYRSHYSISVLQPEDPDFFYATEPEVAAKNIARMMVINRGIGIYVGMSGTGGYDRPIETVTTHRYNRMMDGLSPGSADVTTESGSDLLRTYVFRNDEGDLYIAIWNDGAASVQSDTISCDLTVYGLAAGSAAWLDPYNMVGKGLELTNGPDTTVISGLEIPDYPVFIKIGQ